MKDFSTFSMRTVWFAFVALVAACWLDATWAGDYYDFVAPSASAPTDATGEQFVESEAPKIVEPSTTVFDYDPGIESWLSLNPYGDCIPTTHPRSLVESIDYRMSTMFASHTTYQFGTYPGDPGPQYAPLSKLAWSLDSMWHGLRIGLEKPKWEAHLEWMTPMLHESFGVMEDYDWSGADRPPALLSKSPQHWTDAQTLEIEGRFKLLDHPFTLPIEFWPMIGYRYQRFGMMAYNGLMVLNDGSFADPDIPPVGYRWDEEMGSLNQEYYMGYVGGQLAFLWYTPQARLVRFSLEADWAATSAYNVDHHISGYEARGIHRYTMDNTHGDALHFALIAETPISRHVFVGIQADHTQIRTTGTHHHYVTGEYFEDVTWSNGVKVTSDQTSITLFLRARF